MIDLITFHSLVNVAQSYTPSFVHRLQGTKLGYLCYESTTHTASFIPFIVTRLPYVHITSYLGSSIQD